MCKCCAGLNLLNTPTEWLHFLSILELLSVTSLELHEKKLKSNEIKNFFPWVRQEKTPGTEQPKSYSVLWQTTKTKNDKRHWTVWQLVMSLLLRCLWKRGEVVLEKTVVQARQDLWLLNPPPMPPPSTSPVNSQVKMLPPPQLRKMSPPTEVVTPLWHVTSPHMDVVNPLPTTQWWQRSSLAFGTKSPVLSICGEHLWLPFRNCKRIRPHNVVCPSLPSSRFNRNSLMMVQNLLRLAQRGVHRNPMQNSNSWSRNSLKMNH